MFDSFGIGLGAVLASQMRSQERTDSSKSSPWAVQDGLGIVSVRSFSRLAVWDHFSGSLGCLLGSFWGAPGVVFGNLEGSWARIGSSWALFWALRIAFCSPRTLYAHQLVNSSAIRAMARLQLATRAGGLRAERLN